MVIKRFVKRVLDERMHQDRASAAAGAARGNMCRGSGTGEAIGQVSMLWSHSHHRAKDRKHHHHLHRRVEVEDRSHH